ncbi:DNA cytosine methyltransferase [Chryseobacterium populi]|uniref:DNA cytosine methyltransferase n=1 Tax=Chryseobacterium populi TaxID=1144316 RepID=UPI0005571D53|nr:DNA cytosine methyltransferase [Chryseobacterium populi]
MNNLNYIDLFSGCGGLSLGLHNSNWQGVFAIEKNSDAFKTLEYNLINKKKHFDWPNWLTKSAHDINEVIKNHSSDLKNLRGQINLIAGGPPCQGFSMAGRRNESDERNELIKSYIQFVDLVQPDLIFFENVRGFTMEFKKNKEKGIAYSELVLKSLRDLGYYVQGKLVNFSEYGVPQKRTRFILIGIKCSKNNASQEMVNSFFSELEKNKYSFLKSKKLKFINTVEDAISDLVQSNGIVESIDSSGYKSSKYGQPVSKYQKYLRKNITNKTPDSHRFAKHQETTIKKFQKILDLTKDRRNLDITNEIRLRFNIKKHTIIPLSEKDCSPTITTLPDDYIHYKEPRILTVREYARLQSFPDWYEFKGKYTTGGKLRKKEVPRYSQIGNAIPPLFAEQAGIILRNLLNG